MEALKASSYIIPVKLESEKGKYILIHGYTGVMDIVSEDLFTKINTFSSEADFQEKTLQTLIDRGYLTTKTKDEEVEYVGRTVKAFHKKAHMMHKNFTMIITYNCNFRCPYCFEDRKMKDRSFDLSFTREMVDKAYLAMEQIEPRKQLRNKTIELYGGEPLLAQNRSIVEYIVNTGREKGYKFRATTNGYDLDHFIDFLAPELIGKLQITIDGTRDLHNQKRIHYKDPDTFDKIIANVKQALEKKMEVTIRVNNDNKNVEDFTHLRKYFEECGFFLYPSFKVYSNPIWDNTSISEEEQQSLDILSSNKFLSKHKDMGTMSQCKDYGISFRIRQALSKGEPISFKPVFCISQAGGYALDPLGDIYPCWEIVGNKDYRIGNYKHDSIEWDDEKLRVWHNYNITVHPTCSVCKYALFCGGGCVVHAMSRKSNHCAYFKTMFNTVVNRTFESITK